MVQIIWSFSEKVKSCPLWYECNSNEVEWLRKSFRSICLPKLHFVFLKSSFLASFKMSVSCHFHKKSNLIPTKQDFYFTMNHLEEQEQKKIFKCQTKNWFKVKVKGRKLFSSNVCHRVFTICTQACCKRPPQILFPPLLLVPPDFWPPRITCPQIFKPCNMPVHNICTVKSRVLTHVFNMEINFSPKCHYK